MPVWKLLKIQWETNHRCTNDLEALDHFLSYGAERR